jgi:hypothetical protein
MTKKIKKEKGLYLSKGNKKLASEFLKELK